MTPPLTLDLISATLKWSGYKYCLASWADGDIAPTGWNARLMENDLTGESLMESYQRAFEESTADIIGYIHDDLICHDHLWHQRVKQEFSDESIGLVGFAGAKGHGALDLYTSPYKLSNLGRERFMSNLIEAEQHGERFAGSCDVSVLDGLAIFARRDLLVRCGGWPQNCAIGYIGYDYWICCMARRFGYRIRLVGVACDHLGGKSTGLNPTLGDGNFQIAHRAIYDEFRDVLPARVKEN